MDISCFKELETVTEQISVICASGPHDQMACFTANIDKAYLILGDNDVGYLGLLVWFFSFSIYLWTKVCNGDFSISLEGIKTRGEECSCESRMN